MIHLTTPFTTRSPIVIKYDDPSMIHPHPAGLRLKGLLCFDDFGSTKNQIWFTAL